MPSRLLPLAAQIQVGAVYLLPWVRAMRRARAVKIVDGFPNMEFC